MSAISISLCHTHNLSLQPPDLARLREVYYSDSTTVKSLDLTIYFYKLRAE